MIVGYLVMFPLEGVAKILSRYLTPITRIYVRKSLQILRRSTIVFTQEESDNRQQSDGFVASYVTAKEQLFRWLTPWVVRFSFTTADALQEELKVRLFIQKRDGRLRFSEGPIYY